MCATINEKCGACMHAYNSYNHICIYDGQIEMHSIPHTNGQTNSEDTMVSGLCMNAYIQHSYMYVYLCRAPNVTTNMCMVCSVLALYLHLNWFIHTHTMTMCAQTSCAKQ